MYFHIAHFPLLPPSLGHLNTSLPWLHVLFLLFYLYYYLLIIIYFLLPSVVVIVVGCLQKTCTRPDSQNVSRDRVMATRILYLEEDLWEVMIATLGCCHFDYIRNYLKPKWLATPAVREDIFFYQLKCKDPLLTWIFQWEDIFLIHIFWYGKFRL